MDENTIHSKLLNHPATTVLYMKNRTQTVVNHETFATSEGGVRTSTNGTSSIPPMGRLWWMNQRRLWLRSDTALSLRDRSSDKCALIWWGCPTENRDISPDFTPGGVARPPFALVPLLRMPSVYRLCCLHCAEWTLVFMFLRSRKFASFDAFFIFSLELSKWPQCWSRQEYTQKRISVIALASSK